MCLARGKRRGEGRHRQVLYPTEPRSRSEKSAADAKLEKTSLSAGGFLRVPYGYRSWRRLRYQRAGYPFHPSESPVIRLSGIDGQEYPLPELQIISIIILYILFYNDLINI